ncbi:MAG TPA: lysophospholipid acyltransferase family protein [Candidatus Nitrosotenuis sp.]|jgi:KDO2-lipid IV(A) lauroyltransferase|nr:lysophospholipid acyltransferase family protein [Candidatus Nitrosotenuis sp.]
MGGDSRWHKLRQVLREVRIALGDSLLVVVGACLEPLIGILPLRWALRLGAGLGWAAYHLAGSARRRAVAQLQQALGLDPVAARRTALRSFRNLGKSMVEMVFLGRLTVAQKQALVSAHQGQEHLDRALAQGRGVILVSAHFGSWELLASLVVAAGYPLAVFTKKARTDPLDRQIRRLRQRNGYQILDRDQDIREALKALRANKIVGVLADLDTNTHGVFVDFLGRAAHTATGPAVLAALTGAPVLAAFIVRQPDDTHHVVVEPPIPMQRSSDRVADRLHNTQAITRVIEKWVRRHPDQWIWMHQRWKKRPPGEAS